MIVRVVGRKDVPVPGAVLLTWRHREVDRIEMSSDPSVTDPVLLGEEYSWTRVREPSITWETPDGRYVADNDGECQVGVFSEGMLICAESPDGQLASGTRLLRGPISNDTREQLTVRPRIVLSGQVLNGDGTPCRDATVMFRSIRFGATNTTARKPKPLATNGDGRFGVLVDAPFYGEAMAVLGDRRSIGVNIVSSDGKELVLTLRGTYEIVGRTMAADGRPLAGVAVAAVTSSQEYRAVSTVDGSFGIDVGAVGDYAVSARGNGYVADDPTLVSIEPNQPRHNVTLYLDECAEISGIVVSQDGRVGGLAVLVSEAAQKGGGLDPFFMGGIATDERGMFVYKECRQGRRYDVRVVGPSGSTAYVSDVLAGTGNLVLSLTPSVSIDGVVVDGVSGSAIAGANLEIAWWSGKGGIGHDLPFASASTDSRGRFAFSDLSSGHEYALRVSSMGYAPMYLGGIKPEDPEVKPGVRILLERCGSIEIVVENVPRGGASIRAFRDRPWATDQLGTAEWEWPITTASSTLVWSEAPPSTIWLEAIGENVYAGPISVSVSAGSRRTAFLTLESEYEPCVIVATVVDAFGVAIEGQRVCIGREVWAPSLGGVHGKVSAGVEWSLNSVSNAEGVAMLVVRPGVYVVGTSEDCTPTSQVFAQSGTATVFLRLDEAR